MRRETVEAVLKVLRETNIRILDVTGGAPELNPNFRYLVGEAKKAGSHVMVRTNLTVFFETGNEDLDVFYGDNSVEVIASLPYYTEDNVDRIRGEGTFQKSIHALGKLNRLGYGNGISGRKLNIVYNPAGDFLSPKQETLEQDFKRELRRRFGVVFDKLFAFTNMPLGRFKTHLVHTGGYEKYIGKLAAAFNPATLSGLMCRRLISVGWDGMLYDCDFNQILGLSIGGGCPTHIGDFDYSKISGRKITVGDHCYGCTAGQGST
jgi:radical SAM/Cys-rich protein